LASPLRFLTDEDFDNQVLRGIRRQLPDLEIVRVQDVGLSGVEDPIILEWAYRYGYVLLTHDFSTMPGHVNDRFRANQSIAGVIEVPQTVAIGWAIEEIVLIAVCMLPDECVNQVLYLPL
jgi:hypothetical protein